MPVLDSFTVMCHCCEKYERESLIRRTTFVLICVALLAAFLPLTGKRPSHSSHHSTTTSAGKAEHVSGHTTKNSKYVASYDR